MGINDGSQDPYDKLTHFSVTNGIANWPKPPDIDGVQSGCEFLKSFKEDPFKEIPGTSVGFSATMALSVVTHLHEDTQESIDAAHELAKEYLGLKGAELSGEQEDAIHMQIIEAKRRGPVTCAQVNAHRPECQSCPYFKKITSPITIEGDTFARSRFTGFWNVKIDKHGAPKKTTPDYHGLAKEFRRFHDFISIAEHGAIYIYENSHWKSITDLEIKAFVEDHLDPKPLDFQCREFLFLLKRTRQRPASWFTDSTDGLINLENGIFNVETSELVPHSKEYGFTYILPYPYDKDAECPQFGKFLVEICSNDLEMVEVLQEYLGYAISNAPCYAEKALFLYGPTASNGKSTLVKAIQNMVGKKNYSSVTLDALNKDTKRYMLEHKLFNVSEETNVKALSESEVFKTMVTGGELDVKKLYSQDYTIKNKAKLFILCNSLPRSGDRTEGLYRRMIIFPMNAKFSDDLGNRIADMDDRLLQEMPGIFNFCVEGFKRLKANKYRFTDAQATRTALEQYKVENDNVLLWFKENAEVSPPDYYETKDGMYEKYKRFVEAAGFERPLNKVWFFRGLKTICPEMNEGQATIQMKRQRVVYGIKTNN